MSAVLVFEEDPLLLICFGDFLQAPKLPLILSANEATTPGRSSVEEASVKQCSHHPGSGNRPQGSVMFSEHCQELLETSLSQGIDSLLGLGEWTKHMLTAYSGRQSPEMTLL